MRFILTAILSLLWVLNSFSQEFGTHWVSYPLPDDSTEVLYRKIYHLPAKPLMAKISMASTGNTRLYINERNVTGSIFYEGMRDSTVCIRTFDVTRYLKKGENIIAVWYAPGQTPQKSKQLSLDFYGWNTDTIPFYHKADETWSCKLLKECSLNEKETFDNRKYTNDWKSAEFHSAGWQKPTGGFRSHTTLPIKKQQILTETGNKLAMVLHPISEYSDSLGYHLDFGRPFRGTIRLTIRDAHKGSTININGNLYTCSGEMDEQAFYRFHTEIQREFIINWGKGFKKNCIVNIEGLEISE